MQARWPNRSFWKRTAGYLAGAVCLIWVFHGIRAEQMWRRIGSMSWWWLIPAVICYVASYWCDGARWHYLLKPAGNLGLRRAIEAVYIGLFVNEITPMRFGELVRTYLAGRWMGQPISRVIPSVLVSRLLDVVWLAVGFGSLAVLLPLPPELLRAGDVLGAVVLVMAAVCSTFVLTKPAAFSRWAAGGHSDHGFAQALLSAVGRIGEGLLQIGRGRTLLLPAAFSLGLLVLQAISFWLAMEAYRLSLPLLAGAGVFLIVRLGTAIPNAPANVGSFQFFTVLGLGLFGVDKTAATGFSVVVFIILTVPLWALGLLALLRSGLTLSAIRADLRQLRRAGAVPWLVVSLLILGAFAPAPGLL